MPDVKGLTEVRALAALGTLNVMAMLAHACGEQG